MYSENRDFLFVILQVHITTGSDIDIQKSDTQKCWKKYMLQHMHDYYLISCLYTHIKYTFLCCTSLCLSFHYPASLCQF